MIRETQPDFELVGTFVVDRDDVDGFILELLHGRTERLTVFERALVIIIYGLPVVLIVAAIFFYFAFGYECPNGMTGVPPCAWP